MSKIHESGFSAKVRLAGLIVDYLRVYNRDIDITIREVVLMMTLPRHSSRDVAAKTLAFHKDTLCPGATGPFDAEGIFHVAAMHLEIEYDGEVNLEKMETMIRHCYDSGAVGRSHEQLTANDLAAIYKIKKEEEEDSEDEDEDEYNGDEEEIYRIEWR